MLKHRGSAGAKKRQKLLAKGIPPKGWQPPLRSANALAMRMAMHEASQEADQDRNPVSNRWHRHGQQPQAKPMAKQIFKRRETTKPSSQQQAWADHRWYRGNGKKGWSQPSRQAWNWGGDASSSQGPSANLHQRQCQRMEPVSCYAERKKQKPSRFSSMGVCEPFPQPRWHWTKNAGVVDPREVLTSLSSNDWMLENTMLRLSTQAGGSP